MVSYDITKMFTNIPINEVIELIQNNYINNDNPTNMYKKSYNMEYMYTELF